jgi:hypothetical protein
VAEQNRFASGPRKGRRNKGVKPQLQRAVWLAAKRRCRACGKRLSLRKASTHHIEPVARGGRAGLENLICLCVPCHEVTFQARAISREWRVLKCGCKVEVYKWRVKPTKRVRRFFRSIGVKLRTSSPNYRLRILCSTHGRVYPEWEEPTWHWETFMGRRIRVQFGSLVIHCKPMAGDLLFGSR